MEEIDNALKKNTYKSRKQSNTAQNIFWGWDSTSSYKNPLYIFKSTLTV